MTGKALTVALTDMMGVDLTAIPNFGPGTALTIASEIGPDFSAFPSVQHFCSWLGVAPRTRISGGKPLPGRAHKAFNPVAITATARELACLIYTMVTRGEAYVEKGMEAYEKRRVDRTLAHLRRKARTLGYQLIQPAGDQREPNAELATA